MPIDYLEYLAEPFKAAALDLYLDAFQDKLGPILGHDDRARDVLNHGIDATQCLAAISDQRLVGILAVQNKEGRFLNPKFSAIIRAYGWPGGILRMFGLALIDYSTAADELYVDGIAVIKEMRGKGIGSRLLDLLEKMAVEKRIRRISLEVIDTNPRAEVLYRRLGFKVVKQRNIYLLNFLFNFPFQSSRLMVKNIR
jgi:ribosomal protein S18 acetylase RimI-like enzyme